METAMKTTKGYTMIHLLRLSALSITCVMMCSCVATMVNGTRQQIAVSSTPTGAYVEHGGSQLGVTPCTVMVPRAQSAILTVRMDGYADSSVPMSGRVGGALWANFFVCTVLGTTTDMGNGSAYEYEPGSFHVAMVPVGGTRSLMVADDDASIKRYVLAFYTDIMQEASAGGGEKTAALVEILGWKSGAESTAKMKSECGKSKDAETLAERLILQRMVRAKPAPAPVIKKPEPKPIVEDQPLP
jgi:hypothetical protein